MKWIILFCLALLPLVSRAAWPGGDYFEVRAYAYNLSDGAFPLPIIEGGQLGPTVANKEGVLLTSQQVRRLISAVTGKHSAHPRSTCFNPRHAFVFYDAARKPRAWLEVCFDCLKNRSEPEGIALNVDFPVLAKLCDELVLPRSPGKEFRENFHEMQSFSKKRRAGTAKDTK